MVDPAHLKAESPQLDLGTFAAIDQKELLIQPDDLRSRKPLRGWQRGTASQYGDRKRIHFMDLIR